MGGYRRATSSTLTVGRVGPTVVVPAEELEIVEVGGATDLPVDDVVNIQEGRGSTARPGAR